MKKTISLLLALLLAVGLFGCSVDKNQWVPVEAHEQVLAERDAYRAEAEELAVLLAEADAMLEASQLAQADFEEERAAHAEEVAALSSELEALAKTIAELETAKEAAQTAALQTPAPQAAAPQAAPAAEEPAPATGGGGTVWLSRTGSKYHSNPSCSNMKNPIQSTLDQAIAQGRGACSKCY